ncbi:MAG: FecR domain-containing protein [Sediminibacterium magnilacihabitans]|jgi:transmembrane sensor|nr:FecR domain-containing protein [Sediminibacterium magnilacihabitans]
MSSIIQYRLWELIAKKLSGEASETELKELEETMRLHPDLHYPMQTVADLWHHTPPQQEDAHTAFGEMHLERMKRMGIDYPFEEELPISFIENTPHRNRKQVWFSLSVAAMLIAGVLGYRFLFIPKPATPAKTLAVAASEVSTKYGSKTQLTLPDGSQVWLNAGSKLKYDKNYGAGLREVSLSGEAFFDVVKNPAHPFVIHTEKIDIKVLGTAFNVKSYPGEKHTETSLIRGSIEVTIRNKSARKIILKPNEKLVIANDDEQQENKASIPLHAKDNRQEPFVAISHLTYEPKDNSVVETSWMENKFIFNSLPFEDLALRCERWFDVSIIINDEVIKKKRFTGAFESETVEQVLKALQLTTPFRYTINKKQINIYSK